MLTIERVMTRDVQLIGSRESVEHAARLMEDLNVGVLPVCDGRRLVGIVTDRDITVRAVAGGLNPKKTPVADVMTTHVRWCRPDESLDAVAQKMSATQIRRMPVLDADGHVIGIVSLGDLATRQREAPYADPVGAALREISWPSQPDR